MILEYGEKAGPSPMGEKKTIPEISSPLLITGTKPKYRF